MEYYAGEKLKKLWGTRPCDHPKLEKVYYSGAFLINYACTICGADFTISQKMEMDQKKKNPKNI